jgi:mannose-6-phosphate isomerase
VHTFAGHDSLVHLGLMRGPVIATISQEMVGRAPTVFRYYHERFHYVAGDASAPQGLRLAATIASEASEACATAYEELYQTIIARTMTIARRPWGYYVVLADEADHKVKRIVVIPGKRLSLQKHRRRAEHWFVLSGEALVTRDEEEVRVSAGKCIEIPIGAWHRVQNPATTDLAFIEVQTGDYFGEDDIERKEDDFGRA